MVQESIFPIVQIRMIKSGVTIIIVTGYVKKMKLTIGTAI